jgi:ubiquinone/menaquinone biosynthesis C-methylase UbiE
MSGGHRLAAGCVVTLLSLPTFIAAQTADAGREKWEKVSDILSVLQAEPGKQIADVGAGEGFYSVRIARAVGPTGRVAAVDVSEKYLETLRATIQQEHINNIDVIRGAVDDPRLPAGTFDAALIYNSYHEMTAPESMLKAIFTALKPGGRLVMSEPLHDNLRSATRANQIKEHEISAEYVERELQAVGFEINERRPDFLAFASPDHKGGFWLLVARKPKP